MAIMFGYFYAINWVESHCHNEGWRRNADVYRDATHLKKNLSTTTRRSLPTCLYSLGEQLGILLSKAFQYTNNKQNQIVLTKYIQITANIKPKKFFAKSGRLLYSSAGRGSKRHRRRAKLMCGVVVVRRRAAVWVGLAVRWSEANYILIHTYSSSSSTSLHPPPLPLSLSTYS